MRLMAKCVVVQEHIVYAPFREIRAFAGAQSRLNSIIGYLDVWVRARCVRYFSPVHLMKIHLGNPNPNNASRHSIASTFRSYRFGVRNASIFRKYPASTQTGPESLIILEIA